MRKLYYLIYFLAFITITYSEVRGQSVQVIHSETQHRVATSSSSGNYTADGGNSNEYRFLFWAGWIGSAIFALITILLILDRVRLAAYKNKEIINKSLELHVIQEQVSQTKEELMAINANLESLVEERTLKLSKVNRELDMFLYRSSHDLRRPVTTLMGLVEVSKLGFDEGTAKYLFSKINDTAVHMDTMLEKFFMINTINHELTEVGEVSFEEILEGVQHSSLVHNYAQQVHFNVVVEPGIRFVSDGQLITFILKNLIDNAIIFRCKDGNRRPIIRIEVRAVGNSVGILVHDNGIGIPETHLSEIFTLFYRGSEASKGNGLGLYVVRKAIEKLNGNIAVSSHLGEFTCFHITLPPMRGLQLQTTASPRAIRVSA